MLMRNDLKKIDRREHRSSKQSSNESILLVSIFFSTDKKRSVHDLLLKFSAPSTTFYRTS